MHIVFATTEFVTETSCDGGLANYLDKASRIFAGYEHQITVVVLSKSNEVIEYQKNIKVVRVSWGRSDVDFILKHVKNETLRQILPYCLRSCKINQKIKEIHEKDKIDIVQYCHLGALGLFRLKDIPSVVRMSSFGPTMRLISATDFDTIKGRLEMDIFDNLDIMAMRKVDSVFAPSALNAKVVNKTTGIEVRVLETPAMGIELDEIAQLPNSLEEKKYLLYFGTMSHIKGLKTIVDGIHQILEQNPQFYFVFIGKDCGINMKEGVRRPVVRVLKEKAAEYSDRVIYFPTIQDRQLLNSIIYHAKLCVLPFRLENLPNTCIEAMELGQIVISTYKSGVSQLIKDGYNGFLVKQNDAEALADKIHDVLQMPNEEKRRISENAKKRIEKMKPERFYQYMMQYYQKIIDMSKEKCDIKCHLKFDTLFFVARQFLKKSSNNETNNDKMSSYYNILNKWMKLKEENKSIVEYLARRGFMTVAIYGLGDIGKHLEKELKDSEVTVRYAIDKASVYLPIDIDVYSPERDLPTADAIIVTPVLEYDFICKSLEKKIDCPVISFSDMIDDLLKD